MKKWVKWLFWFDIVAWSLLAFACFFIAGFECAKQTITPEVKIIHTLEFVVVPHMELPEGYGEILYNEPITTDQAIRYLEEARYSHYYWSRRFSNKSAVANAFTGDCDFNVLWVRRYDQIITLLKQK